MANFLRNRWFLIVLMLALVCGGWFAKPLRPFSEAERVHNGITFTVMFLMALPLEASAMWRTIRRPLAPTIAVLITFVIIPLVAWMIRPFLNESLGVGLLVASTTPCSLASASVWTRRAGGNDAISILVTVVTNAICFVVTPAWLVLMTGKSVDSGKISFLSMVTTLAMLIVLPMAIAQVLRLSPRIAQWASRQKGPLSVASQIGILSIVLVGAIRASLKLSGQTAGGSESLVGILVVALIVVTIHVVSFYLGMAIGRMFRLTRPDQIAVGFAGSQKTLMIGITMAISLQVSVFPIVLYHVLQLLIDTVIADRLRESADPSGATT